MISVPAPFNFEMDKMIEDKKSDQMYSTIFVLYGHCTGCHVYIMQNIVNVYEQVNIKFLYFTSISLLTYPV